MNVLIATPCLYQKVDAYFVDSLQRSIKLGAQQGIDIHCTFLSSESILPIARNELMDLAYRQQYDAMVFIDDDETWEPQCLIDILLSDKDVVTVPVVNKGDRVGFNILEFDRDSRDGDYFKCTKSGTGFLKLSKKAIQDLWESSPSVLFRNKYLKNICEFTYDGDAFVGEDITLSKKLTKLGYDIWIYSKYTVKHIGLKMYEGDFMSHHGLNVKKK